MVDHLNVRIVAIGLPSIVIIEVVHAAVFCMVCTIAIATIGSNHRLTGCRAFKARNYSSTPLKRMVVKYWVWCWDHSHTQFLKGAFQFCVFIWDIRMKKFYIFVTIYNQEFICVFYILRSHIIFENIWFWKRLFLLRVDLLDKLKVCHFIHITH